jgi:subtilisin family serine protease
VGGINEYNDPQNLSAGGPELDLVAPGNAIYTLDVMGAVGYNPTVNACHGNPNYCCSFAGSSAATPMAAGVAALIRSLRPDLPVDSIYKILRFSAEDQIHPEDPPGYDTLFGWGRLNAARAILTLVRGDVDTNGVINIADAVYIQSYIFGGGPPPLPVMGTADADCSGVVNVADEIYLISYIFGGGPPPQTPCYHYDY